MSSMLEAALAYAARGWRVFPCKARSKEPATPHGFKDATLDEATIRRWFGGRNDYNVAIRTGSGLLALDVDGEEGDAALGRLELEHGALPETPIQLTARGRHYFYRVPDGVLVPISTGKLGPHLDVRGDGGYILAEPSVHPSGQQYAFDAGRRLDDLPIADAPQWLLAMCRAPSKAKLNEVESAQAPGDRWVEGRRNDALFRLACRLRRAGLGAEGILVGLLAENSASCDPPLGDDEVQRIAASAGRYEHDAETQPTGDADPLTVMPLGDRDPAKIAPRRWIMDCRFLRGQLTVTVAPPGTAKTTLAVHESIAVTTGCTWAGRVVREPGPVIYVTGEDDIDEIDRRIFAAAAAMGADPALVGKRLFRHAAADRALTLGSLGVRGTFVRSPDVDALTAEARRVGAVLVVLDPLADLHDAPENDNTAMRLVAAACRTIAQQADCAVHLLHHTKKPTGASAEGFAGDQNAGRGASALTGVARIVDTLFSMTKAEAPRLKVPPEDRWRYVRLDRAKSNAAPVHGGATWFSLDATKIANGELVATLSPADFGDAEDAARERKRDRYHTIIARLLALVPDRMSVNKAGLALIGQTNTIYADFSGRDFDGKCPQRVRGEIEAAIASDIDIMGETFRITGNDAPSRGANARAKILVRVHADEAPT